MGQTHWTEDLDVLDNIERALTREQHAGLHQALRLQKIEPDAWLAIPSLRQTYGTYACLNVVHELMGQGHTMEQALLEAESRLGIPSKTLETWRRRWLEYAA